tara:strand:+ start:586 stop:1890 length:1305 start_codon:yes stop_codon:yes gene_type:complete
VKKMDREYEELLPRRALGNGHWDKRLKDRMVELSVADNYDEAKREWIVTENVWYIPFGEHAQITLPVEHCVGDELQAHPHECLCGHPIVWHFEIENTENGEKQIVGSEHIESYMVIRHFQKKGYNPEEVTEEMIDEWINEKVKALKAQWWWDLHGDQFTEWFEEVRELDLRVNVRETGGHRWNATTRRNEPTKVIRKRAEGKFGQQNYKMASVVWRWNHPNNTRRQIETRGYPNERLWNDLQMFYILSQRWKDEIAAEDAEIARRVENLAQQDREAEERRERQRIENEERRARDRQRREQRQIEEAELEGVREERRLAAVIADRINAANSNETFKDMCEYYDIPMFTPNIATKDWDKRFLTDMIRQMSSGKQLTERQLTFLRNIVVDEPLPATDKQIWYIKKLAGDDYVIPDDLNRTDASSLIDQLKRTGGLIE